MKLDNILDIVKKSEINETKRKQTNKAGSPEKTYSKGVVREQDQYSYLNVEQEGKGNWTKAVEELIHAADPEYDSVKKGLAAVSNMLTEEDASKLKEEGCSLTDSDVREIVTVVDQIKIKIAMGGGEIFGSEDIDMDKIREYAGDTRLALSIANKLKENDLPITKENMQDIYKAMERASHLTPLSENAMKYMIENGMEPAIDALYKAEYSSGAGKVSSNASYYADAQTGYIGKKSDQFDWDALDGQIENLMKQGGVEATPYHMENARWLISNGLAVSPQNITRMDTIRNVILPQEGEQLLSNIITGMTEGRRPEQALLTDMPPVIERAEHAVNVVESAADEDLEQVIAEGKEVTIENLEQAKQETGFSEEGRNREQSQGRQIRESLAFVTARRQLEELRLKMTLEASVKMLKQGIKVETESLQNLVEHLRETEKSYYENLFRGTEVEASEENIQLLKDTTEKVKELKTLPAAAIGRMDRLGLQKTVDNYHDEGNKLKLAYKNANQSYETMMTQPRSELGDSIQKAFRNVDHILKDLGLETTQSNERAVRILAYNRLEINEESIMKMKEADTQVNKVMQNLTPNVTLELIRRGINPLDTNINDLNQQIEQIKTENGTSEEEKYSEFLYRLEKNDAITEEEKSAYIGIYRLLRQVEKTDGSVIGALVNQGRNITMRSLMSGIRSSRQQGMNVKVGESYPGMNEAGNQNQSISEQIEAGFQKQNENSLQNSYYGSLIQEGLEQLASGKQVPLTSLDISLENYIEQLKQAERSEKVEREYQTEQLKVLEQVKEVDESVVKALSEAKEPMTIHNMLAMTKLLKQRGSAFSETLEKAQEQGEKKAGALKKMMGLLADALNSEEEMQEAYSECCEGAKEVITEAAEAKEVTSLDVRELKLVHTQLNIAVSMSREENYEIPVKISNEITTMNVKIIKTEEEAGSVKVTMEDTAVGKVAAEFTVSKGEVKGLLAVQTDQGLAMLKSNDAAFRNTLAESGIKVRRLNYIFEKNLNLETFGGKIQKAEDESVSTKTLYSVAKAFVVTTREYFVNNSGKGNE